MLNAKTYRKNEKLWSISFYTIDNTQIVHVFMSVIVDFMITFMNLWYLIEHNSCFRFMEAKVQENDEKDE